MELLQRGNQCREVTPLICKPPCSPQQVVTCCKLISSPCPYYAGGFMNLTPPILQIKNLKPKHVRNWSRSLVSREAKAEAPSPNNFSVKRSHTIKTKCWKCLRSQVVCFLFCLVVLRCSVVSDSATPCQASQSIGILQARILDWVAMPSSRGSSQPRD